MPSYKLTYFDARSRGEVIRMLFALKGQAYEDVKFTIGEEEWTKVKGNTERFPFASMPVLEIDGKVMTQSRAIARYLARDFGFFGNNKEEDFAIDEIFEIVADLEVILTPVYDEMDEAKRGAALIKFRDNELKCFLEFFSRSLEKSGGKYFVGNRLTVADLQVYNFIDFFDYGWGAVKGYFDSYPRLTTFYNSIKTDSALAPYLKARKPTIF